MFGLGKYIKGTTDDEIRDPEYVLMSDRQRLSDEIVVLEGRNKELSEIIAKLNSDITLLTTGITDFNKDIHDKEQHIRELDIQIHKLHAEIGELTTLKQQHETAISNINTDNSCKYLHKIITVNADGTKICVSIGTLTKKSMYFQNMFSGSWVEADSSEICICSPPLFIEWYIYYSRYGILPCTYNRMLEQEFKHFCEYYLVDINFDTVFIDRGSHDLLLDRLTHQLNNSIREISEILKDKTSISIKKFRHRFGISLRD